MCLCNKTSHPHPSGLLQPLPILTQIWSDLTILFVEGLPRANNEMVILTVVDPLSKAAHFIPLGHQYTTTSVVWAFFDEVVRLHILPTSIVISRGPIFTRNLCHELFRLSGTKLHMSSTLHPQSNDQSEATDKVIVMYHCLTGDRAKQSLCWLPWSSFASTWLIIRRCTRPRSNWYMGDARAPAVD